MGRDGQNLKMMSKIISKEKSRWWELPLWLEGLLKALGVSSAVIAAIFYSGIWFVETNQHGQSAEQAKLSADSANKKIDLVLAKMDASDSKQTQILKVLEEHTKLMAEQRDRALISYPNMWDTNDEGIAWRELASLNPTILIPDIYRIRRDNPPSPPPR